MDDRTREWAQIAFAQSSVPDIVTALMAKADEEQARLQKLRNDELERLHQLEDVLAEISAELEMEKKKYQASAKQASNNPTLSWVYSSTALGYDNSMEMLRNKIKPTAALKNAQRRRYLKRREERRGQGNPDHRDP